jgi:hypothetical protein
VCVLFLLLDQLTKHEIWYGHYATGTHPKADIFNLIQYVKMYVDEQGFELQIRMYNSAYGKPKLGSTCARHACSKYEYEFQWLVSTQINFITVFITGRNLCIFK